MDTNSRFPEERDEVTGSQLPAIIENGRRCPHGEDRLICELCTMELILQRLLPPNYRDSSHVFNWLSEFR